MITSLDPSLDQALVASVVTQVACGRDKRRRLAAGLCDRPAVLTDGRSPAPEVIGHLLIALRRAGVAAVSPPYCAGCGKALQSMERTRGGCWYCTRCSRQLAPKPCASCGRTRVVSSRDRAGQPRCSQCPDRDDRDPVAVLTAVVTRLDDSVSAETIAAAVGKVLSTPGHLRRLAWILEDPRASWPATARKRRPPRCCGSSASSRRGGDEDRRASLPGLPEGSPPVQAR
jgi:hypothetical protein